MLMNFKQVSFDIKGLDEKEGVIEAYANAYDFKDSDGDISAKGSFNKTVGDNFKRIRVLRMPLLFRILYLELLES